MSDEGAKAVQETAKAVGKLIDGIDKFGRFVERIGGGGLVELGQTFHDWTRAFRYETGLKLQDKVEAIHAKRRLEGKVIPIPPRYLIPLLRNATEDDNEDVQYMWAGLIANATDPSRHVDMNKLYISVLSDLDPLDVKIIKFLATRNWLLVPEVPDGGYNTKRIAAETGVDEIAVRISTSNLYRLGLVFFRGQTRSSWGQADAISGAETTNETLVLVTLLGHKLVSACEA